MLKTSKLPWNLLRNEDTHLDGLAGDNVGHDGREKKVVKVKFVQEGECDDVE